MKLTSTQLEDLKDLAWFVLALLVGCLTLIAAGAGLALLAKLCWAWAAGS